MLDRYSHKANIFPKKYLRLVGYGLIRTEILSVQKLAPLIEKIALFLMLLQRASLIIY